jgi:hypothetical protein
MRLVGTERLTAVCQPCLRQLRVNWQMTDALTGRFVQHAQHDQRRVLTPPALPRNRLDDVTYALHDEHPKPGIRDRTTLITTSF